MLNVLVWGHVEDGPCAYFRGHQFTEELKKLGVNYRGLNRVEFEVMEEGKNLLLPEAMARGLVKIDSSDIDWADVVVFRRYYNTTIMCGAETPCNFVTFSYAEAAKHEHGFKERDLITRLLWPAFLHANHGKAIVYETDDDHFNIQPWNGYMKDIIPEYNMIEEMAKRADLVTVSTSVIGSRYSRFNDNVRVIKNAIEPDLYKPTINRPEGDLPRLLYYGSTARLRDYGGYPDSRMKMKGGYAGKAVTDMARELRTVFIGTNPGTEHIISQFFQEQYGYVDGIPKFCELLANSHPDIGIAPLLGDEFDRAKSELHWLEYSLVGAAFIGERFRGDGPYQVVRDGVDGLLARGRQEWYDAVKKLTRSKDLREQLAGAAKERVLKEYNFKDRAKEWADAFQWAADNRGKGVKVA
jgi:glycosyltransferase involved in cell wall biosynthesis